MFDGVDLAFLDPADDESDDEPLPSGTILTHRMTGPELAGGFVAYEPDLEALDPLFAACGHLHLTGDTVAELDVDDDGNEILVGDDGWLPVVRPGDLVGFRVIGDEVELVGVTEALAPDRLVEPLRAAFDELSAGEGMAPSKWPPSSPAWRPHRPAPAKESPLSSALPGSRRST